MRQLDDAASITLAIVIVVTVGFVQEYRYNILAIRFEQIYSMMASSFICSKYFTMLYSEAKSDIFV